MTSNGCRESSYDDPKLRVFQAESLSEEPKNLCQICNACRLNFILKLCKLYLFTPYVFAFNGSVYLFIDAIILFLFLLEEYVDNFQQILDITRFCKIVLRAKISKLIIEWVLLPKSLFMNLFELYLATLRVLGRSGQL